MTQAGVAYATLWVAVFGGRLAFAWAAPTEKLEAFLEGHVHAFAWLGGVLAECVYDNPKTAVVRILAGPVREEPTRFSSLRAQVSAANSVREPVLPTGPGARAQR